MDILYLDTMYETASFQEKWILVEVDGVSHDLSRFAKWQLSGSKREVVNSRCPCQKHFNDLYCSRLFHKVSLFIYSCAQIYIYISICMHECVSLSKHFYVCTCLKAPQSLCHCLLFAFPTQLPFPHCFQLLLLLFSLLFDFFALAVADI